MARTTLGWGPDTCGCFISYHYDDDKPDGERLSLDYVQQKCPAHKGLHSNDLFAQVRAENKAKNDALEMARQVTAPRLQVVRMTPEGPEPMDAPHIRWDFEMVPAGEGRQKVLVRLRGDTFLGFERRELVRRLTEAALPVEIAPDEA